MNNGIDILVLVSPIPSVCIVPSYDGRYASIRSHSDQIIIWSHEISTIAVYCIAMAHRTLCVFIGVSLTEPHIYIKYVNSVCLSVCLSLSFLSVCRSIRS